MNSRAEGSDQAIQLLRHAVATLAYRAGKTIHDAPPGFANFRAAPGARTPGEILAHLGDLFEWGLSIARGHQKWHSSQPLEWDKEVKRFFAALKSFDDYLSSGAALGVSAEKLFQAPIADALAHTGQLALLRRLAGAPIRGEDFFQAEIVAGRVGADQAAPAFKFD